MPIHKTINPRYLSNKISLSILLLIWATSQIIAYFHFGTMVSVDSAFYINNATSITLGEWPQNSDLLYLTYSLLIALLQVLGLKATWIVVLQVFMSAAAIFSIYRITQTISKNNLAPIVASVLYILWFKFQQWNLIVYTDSLFANSVVVAIFLLINARSKISYLYVIIMVAFTALLRPMGIGFLIAIMSYFLYSRMAINKDKTIVKVVLLGVFVGVYLVILNEVLRDFVPSFLQSYTNAEIIYPGISIGIEKPENLNMPDETYQPLIQLLAFTVQNPIYMIKLSLLKAVIFLGHIKPYYSLFHNLIIAIFLYPVYFFAAKGARLISKNRLYVFMMVFIGFQVLTISLTSENWDGRFLLPLLPWIFIISSFGIISFLQKRYGLSTNNLR